MLWATALLTGTGALAESAYWSVYPFIDYSRMYAFATAVATCGLAGGGLIVGGGYLLLRAARGGETPRPRSAYVTAIRLLVAIAAVLTACAALGVAGNGRILFMGGSER